MQPTLAPPSPQTGQFPTLAHLPRSDALMRHFLTCTICVAADALCADALRIVAQAMPNEADGLLTHVDEPQP